MQMNNGPTTHDARSLTCSLCRHHSRAVRTGTTAAINPIFTPNSGPDRESRYAQSTVTFLFPSFILILFFSFIFIFDYFQQLNLPTIVCRISNNTHGFSLFSHEKHLIFCFPMVVPLPAVSKIIFFCIKIYL